MQIKKIHFLPFIPIKWNPIPDSNRDFVSTLFPKEVCYLRINDFPDEPLWTLHYKDDSINLEDTPMLWRINFRDK
jgi:hypothetical protein